MAEQSRGLMALRTRQAEAQRLQDLRDQVICPLQLFFVNLACQPIRLFALYMFCLSTSFPCPPPLKVKNSERGSSPSILGDV